MKVRVLFLTVFCISALTRLPAVVAQSAGPPVDPASKHSMAATDDVMKPTQNEVRITPELLDAFGRYVVEYEVANNVVLDGDQNRRLTEAASRRLRTMSIERLKEGGPAANALMTTLSCEHLFNMRLDPESARGFGRQLRPATKLVMDFWGGFSEDARPILDPDQQRQLKAHVDGVRTFIDRVDHRLERWSRGKMNRETGLLDRIWDEELPPDKSGKTKELRDAEADARSSIMHTGPLRWREFFVLAAHAFQFDKRQMAAGEKLLRDYTGKAKASMTDEWRARVTALQIKVALRWQCRDEPLDPWASPLFEELSRLNKPIDDLGRHFRGDVLALATPDQRSSLVADLRQVADTHGMTADEVEPMQRLFPQTQPASLPSP